MHCVELLFLRILQRNGLKCDKDLKFFFEISSIGMYLSYEKIQENQTVSFFTEFNLKVGGKCMSSYRSS